MKRNNTAQVSQIDRAIAATSETNKLLKELIELNKCILTELKKSNTNA